MKNKFELTEQEYINYIGAMLKLRMIEDIMKNDDYYTTDKVKIVCTLFDGKEGE